MASVSNVPASIAQMTGSLIDSGCKHIIPVRSSFNFFTRFCNIPQDALLRNKMKYSIHKGDLILAVGHNMWPYGQGMYNNNEAYPSVTTTMQIDEHDYNPTFMDYLSQIYHMTEQEIADSFANKNHGAPFNLEEEEKRLQLDDDITNHEKLYVIQKIKTMPDFRFMGFSLGLGYAHPNTGDTVVSSMIGGLITVRNGPFRLCTGDKVQWCFFFEMNNFDTSGRRLKADDEKETLSIPNDSNTKRLKTMLQQNGVFDFQSFKKNLNNNKASQSTGKIPLAVIKPYFEGYGPHDTYPRDRMRVIGKALGNGRPWDNVDIMICTQH